MSGNRRVFSDPICVDDYVKDLRPAQAKIVTSLRDLILTAAPDTVETFRWGQPVYEFNGPFCFIEVKGHANLGFWRGTELPGSKGLLKGRGVKVRHVRLLSIKDTKKRELRDLVKYAVKLNGDLVDPTKPRAL